MKVGIVGCGAMGSSLAKIITRDFTKEVTLVALYDIATEKSYVLSQKISNNRSLGVNNLKKLIDRSQLVIEAASMHSSLAIAAQVLTRGRNIIIMSAGGILGHLQELQRLAGKHNARVYIPSGAISGVDALKSAASGKINQVTLTTRKHPVSLKGAALVRKKGIDLGKIKKDTVLFCGSAAQAVKYFPQNINVAAVLSLAGIGPHRTKIKIVASPSAKRNIHEIRISSSAGEVFTRTENVLHPDNPKTSYLAVLSAVATLKQIFEPVRIGT